VTGPVRADAPVSVKAMTMTLVVSPSGTGEMRGIDVGALDPKQRQGLLFRSARGEGGAVLLVDGQPLAEGQPVPKQARTVALQGTKPGRLEVDLGTARLDLRVLGLVALDAGGETVDLQRSRASIERTPPAREHPIGEANEGASPDALRYVLFGGRDDLPPALRLVSRDASGKEIDSLATLPLGFARCPKGVAEDQSCRASQLVRAVADDVDRNHPLVKDRSIRAEVGGTIELYDATGGERLHSVRVGGPRTTPAGPIERLRGKLRITIVRDAPSGAVPFGANDVGAVDLARRQVAWANALWGQCGVSFGPPEKTVVRVIDPPVSHLVAMGCDLGLPSGGGEVRFQVAGKEVRATLGPGLPPRAAARVVASAVEKEGFVVRLSENVRIGPGAYPTVDLLVRHRDGKLARVEPPASGRTSTDPTMSVCIGEVDLRDGLDHFTDMDAAAGTVEERTLVKSIDDTDPGTIEVILIPAFARGGRIGESFIFADRSSIRNVVIADRAGVRADRASFALAHELGHVLLDMPGHPDDFGVDTPTLLMDSDAADLSAFGPRRLTLDDCARALRQSGPKAPTVLLEPWPLP